MLRCPAGSAGKFKVSLHVANHKELYRAQIGSHQPVFMYGANGLVVQQANGNATVLDEAPAVDNFTPYEGELCEHELAFLNGMPGKDYKMNYEFTVEEII